MVQIKIDEICYYADKPNRNRPVTAFKGLLSLRTADVSRSNDFDFWPVGMFFDNSFSLQLAQYISTQIRGGAQSGVLDNLQWEKM